MRSPKKIKGYPRRGPVTAARTAYRSRRTLAEEMKGESMARPREEGLRYFSLDVDIFSNWKIRALRAKFGSDGPQFYLYILCEVYRGRGYYLQTDEYFHEMAAAEIGCSVDKIGLMLNFLANKSMLLDGTLFVQDKVLSSREIQRRFQEGKRSAGRKTPIIVDERFWILPAEETETFIQVRRFSDNSGKNPNYSGKNAHSSRKNAIKKRKVNESKVNERKESGAGETEPPEAADWIAALPLSLPLSAQKKAEEYMQAGMTVELILWAANKAAELGKPWPYFLGILKGKLKEGVFDITQLPQRQRPRRETSYDPEEFDRRGFSLPADPAQEDEHEPRI